MLSQLEPPNVFMWIKRGSDGQSLLVIHATSNAHPHIRQSFSGEIELTSIVKIARGIKLPRRAQLTSFESSIEYFPLYADCKRIWPCVNDDDVDDAVFISPNGFLASIYILMPRDGGKKEKKKQYRQKRKEKREKEKNWRPRWMCGCAIACNTCVAVAFFVYIISAKLVSIWYITRLADIFQLRNSNDLRVECCTLIFQWAYWQHSKIRKTMYNICSFRMTAISVPMHFDNLIDQNMEIWSVTKILNWTTEFLLNELDQKINNFFTSYIWKKCNPIVSWSLVVLWTSTVTRLD